METKPIPSGAVIPRPFIELRSEEEVKQRLNQSHLHDLAIADPDRTELTDHFQRPKPPNRLPRYSYAICDDGTVLMPYPEQKP
jgi:hypothetical protein